MEKYLNQKGRIFNIQHYSIHDGPGIRTTVFLKGCPLRCLWCQNPESYTIHPQLFFIREKCSGCGMCITACSHGAIQLENGYAKTDRNLCKNCGMCVEKCLNEARTIVGEEVTAGEVFAKIEKDKIFYDGSGGGATISGGEPLAQPEFTKSILKLCREAGIHTVVETSGYAKEDIVFNVLKYADMVFHDLKHMNPEEHRKLTGVTNETILKNIKHLYHDMKKEIVVRMPIIPGYNDSDENIKEAARFILEELDKSVYVHLLPFHRLGESKIERMEAKKTSFSSNPPDDRSMEKLKQIMESYGLKAQIGG
ncbi:MAG: glycyl-radical enzyme activating protein [Tepidanaerobacteraceae bacterium]